MTMIKITNKFDLSLVRRHWVWRLKNPPRKSCLTNDLLFDLVVKGQRCQYILTEIRRYWALQHNMFCPRQSCKIKNILFNFLVKVNNYKKNIIINEKPTTVQPGRLTKTHLLISFISIISKIVFEVLLRCF